MFSFIKEIFGMGPQVDVSELVKNGALIVDVRTKGEYHGGHIKGSINIPLDSLTNELKKINKDSIVITCCASGIRSAAAKNLLLSNEFKEVYNGGGWQNLLSKIKST